MTVCRVCKIWCRVSSCVEVAEPIVSAAAAGARVTAIATPTPARNCAVPNVSRMYLLSFRS